MDERRESGGRRTDEDPASVAGSERLRKRRGGNNAGRKKQLSGWRSGLSIGALALIIAMVLGGPIGGYLRNISLLSGLVLLFASIGVAIAFDILAVAATAGQEAPFHAMASKKVPGAREALGIVRNAARVNSLCGDVIGDICGTLSGVVATPVILSIHTMYPGIPLSIISMVVIGLIAFFTIGGKAAEKGFSVRSATTVILLAGRGIHYFNRLTEFLRLRNR